MTDGLAVTFITINLRKAFVDCLVNYLLLSFQTFNTKSRQQQSLERFFVFVFSFFHYSYVVKFSKLRGFGTRKGVLTFVCMEGQTTEPKTFYLVINALDICEYSIYKNIGLHFGDMKSLAITTIFNICDFDVMKSKGFLLLSTGYFTLHSFYTFPIPWRDCSKNMWFFLIN